MVRSIFLQDTRFWNQKVLQKRGERHLFTKIHVVELYPNENISISTKMIFDADGAKHSPPGAEFQKSEGPHVAIAKTPFHWVCFVNSHPNK